MIFRGSMLSLTQVIWTTFCLQLLLTFTVGHIQEICTTETFSAECASGEVIAMETAQYGRMERGLCLKDTSGDIGCTNDVLYLLDQWCSGLQRCEFTPFIQFGKEKTEWCLGLIPYMKVAYSCLSVTEVDRTRCSSSSKLTLTNQEGFLGSRVTDVTGCGSPDAPWVIEAKPGQKVNISIIDFGALATDGDAFQDCNKPLGYITEDSDADIPICGTLLRKKHVFMSKSHTIQIQIAPTEQPRAGTNFLLHYEIVGCADLSPPAHAWYTRDGNHATIGCDVTERVWHLECRQQAWMGVVGNCTPAEVEVPKHENKYPMPLHTVLMLAAIISSTLFLSLLILCMGFCYAKRYRNRHRSNKEQMTALTIYRKSTEVANSHYRPVSTCSSCHGTLPPRDQNQDQAPKTSNTDPGYAHIWERPLPDPTHRRAPSSVSEYLTPNNTNSRNNPPGGTADTQKTSLLEDDNTSGYYCPETGHKYYVLDQTQC